MLVVEVRDFWSPLATAKARKQARGSQSVHSYVFKLQRSHFVSKVMRARADVEVALGLIMVVGAAQNQTNNLCSF